MPLAALAFSSLRETSCAPNRVNKKSKLRSEKSWCSRPSTKYYQMQLPPLILTSRDYLPILPSRLWNGHLKKTQSSKSLFRTGSLWSANRLSNFSTATTTLTSPSTKTLEPTTFCALKRIHIKGTCIDNKAIKELQVKRETYRRMRWELTPQFHSLSQLNLFS